MSGKKKVRVIIDIEEDEEEIHVQVNSSETSWDECIRCVSYGLYLLKEEKKKPRLRLVKNKKEEENK